MTDEARAERKAAWLWWASQLDRRVAIAAANSLLEKENLDADQLKEWAALKEELGLDDEPITKASS